ncbi:flocculation protein FLO11-like [Lytechinus variegatus]|uniref:flocculation protein FLO11-like n=1 Tax=Lytechinus variegatus TaxID=7654 RepID=UPI001BB105CF|nr:flocculation protein FLO11-like [Lytechinus variegatus]
MSEMAKYLKKQRISLHDIIFKNRKSSREEIKRETPEERVVVQVVAEKGAIGIIGQHSLGESRKCPSPKPVRSLVQVTSSAPDNVSAVDRNVRDGMPVFGRTVKRTPVDSESCENSSGSDNNEGYRYKSDSDSSDENYIISRYFRSMALSDEEEPSSGTRLGVPVIETGSSRSLSAIPSIDMPNDTSLSRSCYEICSNRIPGTPCGSSCSMSFKRQKKGKSSMTNWSNAGSEGDITEIIPLGSSTVTSKTNRSSKQETLSPLNLSHFETTPRSSSVKSINREPSSLHVSPSRSPNLSGDPTTSPSSVMSGDTLPPAPSPFSSYDVANHRSLRPGSAVMLPHWESNLLPIRPSSSNPAINKSSEYQTIPSHPLRPVQLSPLTRSNPNLCVYSPSGSSRSLSPSSAFGTSPSTSPRLLSPLPIPIPPSSPRPTSQYRRAPRVKKTKTKFQQNFDNL